MRTHPVPAVAVVLEDQESLGAVVAERAVADRNGVRWVFAGIGHVQALVEAWHVDVAWQ